MIFQKHYSFKMFLYNFSLKFVQFLFKISFLFSFFQFFVLFFVHFLCKTFLKFVLIVFKTFFLTQNFLVMIFQQHCSFKIFLYNFYPQVCSIFFSKISSLISFF
jgi:hypothetical protein